MTTFSIGDARVEPGSIGRGHIVGGYRDDGTEIKIPLLVMHGSKPGPVLWLGSTVHGIEIVGVEIIRRVIRDEVDPSQLSGTIIGAPIQNPVAFLDQSYINLRDGLNINRHFPGNPEGGFSERLIHALYSEGLAKADMVVDIHANTAPAVPFAIIRTGTDEIHTKARKMADAYGITILESTPKPAAPGEKPLSGLLMDAALHDGKAAIILEYEAFTMDQRWVEAGAVGTLNLLKAFDMISGDPVEVPGVEPLPEPVNLQVVLRATYGGLVHQLLPVGTRVSPGDAVARVVDPLGNECEVLKTSVEGFVLCYPRTYGNQSVSSGDEVAFVAPIRSA